MKQICNRALAVLLAGALCVAGAPLALADEAKANAGIVASSLMERAMTSSPLIIPGRMSLRLRC